MTKTKEFLTKNKPILMYLIFGGLTTLLNWFTFALLSRLGLNENASNILSWISSVLFAYITNRTYVFHSTESTVSGYIKEFTKFISSRIFTGIIEIFGFPFLVHIGLSSSIFGIEGFMAKIIVTVISVVLNYFLSKMFIFSSRKKAENQASAKPRK